MCVFFHVNFWFNLWFYTLFSKTPPYLITSHYSLYLTQKPIHHIPSLNHTPHYTLHPTYTLPPPHSSLNTSTQLHHSTPPHLSHPNPHIPSHPSNSPPTSTLPQSSLQLSNPTPLPPFHSHPTVWGGVVGRVWEVGWVWGPYPIPPLNPTHHTPTHSSI